MAAHDGDRPADQRRLSGALPRGRRARLDGRRHRADDGLRARASDLPGDARREPGRERQASPRAFVRLPADRRPADVDAPYAVRSVRRADPIGDDSDDGVRSASICGAQLFVPYRAGRLRRPAVDGRRFPRRRPRSRRPEGRMAGRDRSRGAGRAGRGRPGGGLWPSRAAGLRLRLLAVPDLDGRPCGTEGDRHRLDQVRLADPGDAARALREDP